MKRPVGIALLVVLLAAGALGAHGDAAPPDMALAVPWAALSGGGGQASGGGYRLSATAAQPAVGSLAGGGYSITGGFWAVAVDPLPPEVYLPLMLSR